MMNGIYQVSEKLCRKRLIYNITGREVRSEARSTTRHSITATLLDADQIGQLRISPHVQVSVRLTDQCMHKPGTIFRVSDLCSLRRVLLGTSRLTGVLDAGVEPSMLVDMLVRELSISVEVFGVLLSLWDCGIWWCAQQGTSWTRITWVITTINQAHPCRCGLRDEAVYRDNRVTCSLGGIDCLIGDFSRSLPYCFEAAYIERSGPQISERASRHQPIIMAHAERRVKRETVS